MFNLKGKTALITGAARRIGRSLALELARQGANLVIHYGRSEAEARKVREEAVNLGVKAHLVKADLGKPDSCENLIENTVMEAGRLDILINNASVFPANSIQAASVDDLNNVMQVNAWAPFLLSRSFAQRIGRGKIVNILDTRITGFDFDRFTYYLSKKMLETLTRSLALGFSPNMTVNAVAPGLILPPEGKDLSYLERLKGTVPLKRYGSVSDVVDAVLFLLRSDFITGQVIYVDGGKHLVQTIEGRQP